MFNERINGMQGCIQQDVCRARGREVILIEDSIELIAARNNIAAEDNRDTTENDEDLIHYYNSTDRDISLARELIETLELETGLMLSNKQKNIILKKTQKICNEYSLWGSQRATFKIYERLSALNKNNIELESIKQVINIYGPVEEFDKQLCNKFTQKEKNRR